MILFYRLIIISIFYYSNSIVGLKIQPGDDDYYYNEPLDPISADTDIDDQNTPITSDEE